MPTPADSRAAPGGFLRLLRLLRPSHQHSALSATLLLMVAVMLSRVIGYLREGYIAWAFGAGGQTDAYVAAFTLPDWVNYLLAGGTVSITFISILARYRSEGREQEAQNAVSTVLTFLSLLLGILIVLAEIFTPQFTRWWFPEFSPQQVDLCVWLTRILLPGQLFFILGGVLSADPLSRRMFVLPAMAPLLYNVFIILGGIVLGKSMGVGGLAVGALTGMFVGPFLVNGIAALKCGFKFRFALNLSDPGFREWFRLTLPLMLGVSLVSADDWIMRHFASGGLGDITRLNYAKRLVAVPIAVLGQAAGQASLPFFAKLWGEKNFRDFAGTVNGAVYRIVAASFLVSAWLMATALPLVDLLYRRGRFHFTDSQETSVFFFWFSLSLAFWAAQGLYARAFYAAGNTLLPMVAATLLTVASIPVYGLLFRQFSVTGLAIASDFGILINTIAVAVLLDRRRLVPASGLKWGELGKALLTAVVAGLLGGRVASLVPLHGSRRADFESLALGTLTWAAAVAAGLWLTRSELPGDLRRRKAPRV